MGRSEAQFGVAGTAKEPARSANIRAIAIMFNGQIDQVGFTRGAVLQLRIRQHRERIDGLARRITRYAVGPLWGTGAGPPCRRSSSARSRAARAGVR